MTIPHRTQVPPSPLAGHRTAGAIRTLLITYGVTVGGWLLARSTPEDSPLAADGIVPAWLLVLCGLAVQMLMIGARALLRRHAPGPVAAAQGLLVLEIIGDGVTVLLFALGTFAPYQALFDSL